MQQAKQFLFGSVVCSTTSLCFFPAWPHPQFHPIPSWIHPQFPHHPHPHLCQKDFATKWIDDFKKISCLPAEKCTDHDPRVIKHFYQKGLALSRVRAKIFEDLIKNDPKLAFERSISQGLIEKLPAEIQKNLETWHEGFGDLRSQYNCKGGVKWIK